MKKLFLILVALLLTALLATGLAESVTDPGAGKPTVEMPANDSFDNPALLIPGTFYRGGKDVKYQMSFVPPVTGTYTVYGKTDGEYSLSFEILDDYKNTIGWSFSNNQKRIPVERNVELEAGKTYHFSGTHWNNRWSDGSFTIALYPTDYSSGTVGMPAMTSFDNPCKIKTDIVYRGDSDPKYQLVFTPEVSGTYLVYGEADSTKALHFAILDRNKQEIGWSFNNNDRLGPIYSAVEMKANEEYHFVGYHWNGRWSDSTFSFSLSHVDENEAEQIMSAMTSFNYPAHIKENIAYKGAGNTKYKQVFVPEKDGLYTITVTTDDTIQVSFKVVDQYQQDIGWSLNNNSIKGTKIKNIVLKAETEYYFVGEHYNSTWSSGAFTFSIAPAAGENANLLPAMRLFSNPGVIEAGTLYYGDAGDRYELLFTPAETGLYSVYAKTEQPKNFYIKILNEYKEPIGWKMNNGGKQAPAVSSVELEASKEYHFTGDLSSSVWGDARFEFAICAPSKHAGALSDFQTVQEPTCTEPGFSAQMCSLCQQPVNRQEIPAAGHTPGEPTVYQQPTCVANGVTVTLCSVCGEELERSEIPATGHTPGEPIVYKQATCLAVGLKITQCTVCGAEVAREEIPTTGHQPSAWEDLKPVTCTADGQRVQRCSVCGETLNTETVAAFGHSPMDWQITREAACLQSGLREKKCSVCGVSLEQEELPALGHSYTEWETTIEATKEAEGERTRHCIHCGDTQHEAIEKLSKFLGIF